MALFPYRTPAPRPADAEPERPDEATRLGGLRSVHVPPPMQRPYAAAAALAAAVGLPMLAQRAFHPEILGLAIPAVAAIGVATLWRALRRRGLRVELHAGGVVVSQRGKRDVVIFEDVDEVWFDLRWQSSYFSAPWALVTAVRIVDHDGKKHRVPAEVSDPVAVVNWILRNSSDPLLPEARHALAAGEALTFGKVRIDRDGITVGKARAGWRDLRLVRLMPGRVAFFRGFPVVPWRTVSLDEVPHPTVFMRLVGDRAPRVETEGAQASSG